MNRTTDHGATTRSAWSLVVVCCFAVLLHVSPADASRDLPDSLTTTIAGPVAGPADLARNASVRPELPLFSAADKVALTYGYDGPDQLLSLTSGRGSVGGRLFQGLWTDPVTGIAYARNRWYDARTASWLSEDPMGSVDSPNLYAAFGWAPHLYTDPMGNVLPKSALWDPETQLYKHEGNWYQVNQSQLVYRVDLNQGAKHTYVKDAGVANAVRAMGGASGGQNRAAIAFAAEVSRRAGPAAALAEAEAKLIGGFTDVGGTIEDIQALRTGRDFYDKDVELSTFDKALHTAGLLPLVSGRMLRTGADAIEGGFDAVTGVFRGADETAEIGGLVIQRRLAEVTSDTRNVFVSNPDELLDYLKPGEIDAIVEEPWRMRLFFGTALERRVAKIAEGDSVLSTLTHTATNAPQDFIAPNGLNYDITGGSLSSIRSHFKREGVDVVVTYESIADTFGHEWVEWYLSD